ncbi:MAG: MFS transporter [Halioglobus sp.]|nr:MFS transporter [Halioglobus sp.]
MADPRTTPPQPRNLFKNSQYRWLLAGNTAMFFGFFGTMLLRSLLVWEVTGDEIALAYVNVLAAAGMFATSMVSGVLIDRYERKRFLLLAQVTILCAESMILVLLLLDELSYTALLLNAAASSIAFPFIMPSRTAMLVAAVDRSVLASATAWMSAGVNAGRMISPAAVGIFADIIGFVFCYTAILILHGVSLLCTFGLTRYPAPMTTRQGLLREMLLGFNYIIEHRSLGLCILFGMLPMLIVIPLQQLLVVYVDDIWQSGSSGLGLMMAATGIGGMLGSLSMALVRESLVGPMLLGSVAVGAVLLVFGHVPWFWLAVLAAGIVFAASVLTHTAVQVAVQFLSEDFIRGRVTTITMMSMSVAPMGTLFLAYATQALGAPWAITFSGAALILVSLLFWALLPAFRRIDELCSQGAH